MRTRLGRVGTVLCAAAALFLTACGERGAQTLRVLHAGSLSEPFARIEAAFETANPGVDVLREAHGSATAIRQITELGRTADVVASADCVLIDRLMIKSSPQWARWNVLFARNEMCIAYGADVTPPDLGAWADALLEPGRRVGMSDPNQDPGGYRALFTVYLAGGSLFRELVAANSNVTVEADGERAVIRVPGAVRYRGRLSMRPKEADLLALLETGVVDYAFVYRSVAVQRGVPHVRLPEAVNLTGADLAHDYGRVSVVQHADRPDRAVEVVASPIVYGITVPTTARDAELAHRFVEYVVGPEGQAVMESCGQTPVDPPLLSPASDASTVHLAGVASD